ncbi:VOC family protein [Listeria booriae]|uniref:VOC family protein n=1 Tax=Listeria booriae TaxID=1552123 RepID=A0A7X1CGZ8_9LIST|nr:VOC family protein [Listeria booriae]MBC1777432.1 VOC family protein [Listeria booriae]MBC2035741.1 VOC family protein [Listeria booriae]MBC2163231.1 VOC family protein [Listeria booriae]MBC2315868.1 VOC family protein [Listeria booriae]MBC2323138.1 VOC family protein [Listeria booriae]
MIGFEIDMVVEDCLEAVPFYQSIFDLEIVEATSFAKGLNEAVFKLHGARFHLLDENSEYQLIAPKPGDPTPIWFNVTVADINDTFQKAVAADCKVIQGVTEMMDSAISNAMFSDKFGYVWMLHQVHREVSFEERVKMFEDAEKKAE